MPCKLTNPEPDLIYLAVHPRRQCPSALLIPDPGTRHLGTTPIAANPTKLLKLARQAYCPPCSACLPPDPAGVFPCAPLECAVPLASRTSGHNKVCCWFFPEPFLYLLLWPHLTKHLRKRYKTNTKLSARHYNEYIHVISVSVAISI